MMDEGVKQADGFDGPAPKAPAGFGAAESLEPFEAQYAFFTPALLYLHGCFFDEPLARFMAESGMSQPYLFHHFERPIFAGFQDIAGHPGWNHTLWCMEKTLYPAFESFILSLAIVSPAATFRYGAQDVTIADPLACVKSNRLRPMPVVVLGVDSTLGCMATDILRTSWHESPALRWYAARPALHDFARNVAAGDLTGAQNALGPPVHFGAPGPPVLRRMEDVPGDKAREYQRLIEDYRRMPKK